MPCVSPIRGLRLVASQPTFQKRANLRVSTDVLVMRTFQLVFGTHAELFFNFKKEFVWRRGNCLFSRRHRAQVSQTQ